MSRSPFIAAIEAEKNPAHRRVLLLKALREFKSKTYDPEMAHSLADDALLAYVGSEAVTDAFNSIHKWYA